MRYCIIMKHAPCLPSQRTVTRFVQSHSIPGAYLQTTTLSFSRPSMTRYNSISKKLTQSWMVEELLRWYACIHQITTLLSCLISKCPTRTALRHVGRSKSSSTNSRQIFRMSARCQHREDSLLFTRWHLKLKMKWSEGWELRNSRQSITS